MSKTDVKAAEKAWRDAERKLYDLDAEYQGKRADLADKYRPRLEKAGDEAHRLQKEFCDLQAFSALLDRPDGESVARAHVEQGGMTQEQFDDLFPQTA